MVSKFANVLKKKGVRKHVEADARRHPGEVADRGPGARKGHGRVGRDYTRIHDAHMPRRQPHALRHETGEVAADRDEQVDLARPVRQQRPEAGGGGRLHRIEPHVLVLQAADDGAAQIRPQPPCDAQQKRVGEMHDVRRTVLAQPGDQPVQLVRLPTLLAPQHGGGHVLQPFGIGRSGPARGKFEQRPGVQPSVKRPSQPSKAWKLLVEVDVDRAVEYRGAVNRRVGGDVEGQIHGRQGHIDAQPSQGAHEGEIADAVLAIEGIPAARCEVNNLHTRPDRTLRAKSPGFNAVGEYPPRQPPSRSNSNSDSTCKSQLSIAPSTRAAGQPAHNLSRLLFCGRPAPPGRA